MRRDRTPALDDPRAMTLRRSGQAVLVVLLLLALVLFFLPSGWTINRTLVRLWTLEPHWLREVVSPEALADFCNAVAFAVLFFVLRIAFPRWRTLALMLGALVASAGIETVQFLLLPGREAQVRDLVTNTLGGWVGSWCAWMVWNELLRWWRHRDLDRGQLASSLRRSYSSSSPSR